MSSGHRRPALYGHIVADALRSYAAESGLRSEEHRRFTDFFVDTGNALSLSSPDWQAVYGRRGTGKTHLLGYFVAQTNSRHQSPRSAIMITPQRLQQRSFGARTSQIATARDRFVSVLDAVATQLTLLAERRLATPAPERPWMAALARSNAIDGLVKLLDLSRSGPDPSLMAGYSLSSSLAGEQSVTAREPYVVLAESFGATTLSVLGHLGISRLTVCIDEWSTLDPTGGPVIQPEVADLLKLAFKGTDLLSLKLATNRFQTNFNNQSPSRGFRGLELGADITDDINLDHVAMAQDDLVLFYEKLLFKRLVALEPRMDAFRERDGDISPQFVLSMFHDRVAFRELVTGSDAIPRNFLRTITKLYGDYGYDPRDLWRASQVLAELKDRGAERGREVGYRTQAYQLMNFAIRPVVVRTGRREFLVRKSSSRDLSRGFDELFEKRLLHELLPGDLPQPALEEFVGYRLDYGVFMDWLDLLGPSTHPYEERREGLRDEPGWTSLVIDTSGVEVARLECPHCLSEFSPEEPAFRARRLCSECFEDTGIEYSAEAPFEGSP